MKRILLAAGAGLLAVGAVSASAASLGGITGKSVGVDDEIVASCDTDGINVAYTYGYNATSGKYDVTGVDLTGVNAACNGMAYSLTLADNTNAALGSALTGTLTVASGAASVPVTSGRNGESVSRIALIITG